MSTPEELVKNLQFTSAEMQRSAEAISGYGQLPRGKWATIQHIEAQLRAAADALDEGAKERRP